MPALLTVIAVRSGRREAIRDLLAGPVAQPSFYPQLFLVDPHEVMHAVEPEIDMRHLARIHGGSETLLGVTTIDPARLQAVLVRRLVVMEHALGRVQDLLLLQSWLHPSAARAARRTRRRPPRW